MSGLRGSPPERQAMQGVLSGIVFLILVLSSVVDLHSCGTPQTRKKSDQADHEVARLEPRAIPLADPPEESASHPGKDPSVVTSSFSLPQSGSPVIPPWLRDRHRALPRMQSMQAAGPDSEAYESLMDQSGRILDAVREDLQHRRADARVFYDFYLLCAGDEALPFTTRAVCWEDAERLYPKVDEENSETSHRRSRDRQRVWEHLPSALKRILKEQRL